MDSTALEPSHNGRKLDDLPAEILIRIFSFVIGNFTPRMQIGEPIHQWTLLRLPSISYFMVSKTLNAVAHRARLECFSGTIKYGIPTVHPYRLKSEQAYLQLQSRLNRYLNARVKRHIYHMGSGDWIPSLLQEVDTRHPVSVEFVIRAIFDPLFWHCVARVPLPVILSGGADRKLETWLKPEAYRLSKQHHMLSFIEYPWSEVPKNVEIYLTAQCMCSIPGTQAKYPLDIVFAWKDGWRKHKTRFVPDKSLSPKDIERLLVDDGGLFA